MKKAIKLNSLVVLLLSFVVFTACVEDDDFSLPSLTVVEPILDGPVTDIDAVLGAYNQAGELITYDGENNLYMQGYVISNDEGGNWFKELVLQDRAENPTAGIVIQLDVNPLFTRYEFGRKVYINLKGLSVAEANGVIQIGRGAGNDIERVAESMVNDVVLKSAEMATIVPKEVSLSDFSNDLESQYIRLTNMQFNRTDVLGDDPKTFASEDNDQFDGERTLESCVDGGSVILSTSTFSDFKSLLLPSGQGSVNAILTRDFFDDFYTVYVNSPEDLNFDNGTRCDPIELDCGTAAAQGTMNLFNDNFESQTNNALISGNGWTNFIQEGSEGWEAYTSGGTNASLGRSARVGSFNSGDANTISWLITPAIDFDAQTNETLVFQTSNSFSDGSNMELLFSTDWDGVEANIASATWGILPAAYVVQDSDFFGDWLESGVVDLSCAEGTMYLAFKYTGSGESDFDGTYELDEISIDYTP